MIKTVQFGGNEYRIVFRYLNWNSKRSQQNRWAGRDTSICQLWSRPVGNLDVMFPTAAEGRVSRHVGDTPNRNVGRDAAFRKMLKQVIDAELKKLLVAAYFGRKEKKNAQTQ